MESNIGALYDPCWNMARFATLEWPWLITTIGKGSVLRNKNSSGTHVFDSPKNSLGGPQRRHSTSSGKMSVPEF
jgi:hypothetical protein